MSYEFETRPLSDVLGVEVIGLDLARPLPEKTARDLYSLWLDQGVLLFRDADIDADALVGLARVFGTPQPHPITAIRVEGRPEVSWLSNKNKELTPVYYKAGKALNYVIPWHTDLMYEEVPARGNVLRALVVPAEGGQTGFIDISKTYEALPEDVKRRIEGMEILFTFRTSPCEAKFDRDEELVPPSSETMAVHQTLFPDFPMKAHPLVLEHPETGRKALNVSPFIAERIVGLEEQESFELLSYLIAHSTRECFAFWHDWRPHDILIGDNLRTMHAVRGVPPHFDRLLQRVALQGIVRTGRVYTDERTAA